MNEKRLAARANGLFLTAVLLSLLANIFVSLLKIKGINLHIVANLLISQLIILIPGLMYYLVITRNTPGYKIYKRIKPLSVLLLIVFTWLMMPLVTVANVFSQLFTSNEVMNVSESVLNIPIVPMILIMGVFGPFCEEFVFRGLINKSFVCDTGRYVASGLVSALFFGLMHMNFNQFCYAFVLGIVFALIDEILDSTWPSFICHAIVNTQNVLMLYIVNKIFEMYQGTGISEAYSQALIENGGTAAMSKAALIVMLAALLVVSLVTTSLAALLFYGICAIEGKENKFKEIFLNHKRDDEEATDNLVKIKKRIMYPMGMAAITVCTFVMFFLDPIVKLLSK